MKSLIRELEEEYIETLDPWAKQKIKFLKLERIYRKNELTAKQERKKRIFEAECREKNTCALHCGEYDCAPHYRTMYDIAISLECYSLAKYLLKQISKNADLDHVFARGLIYEEDYAYLDFMKNKVNPERVLECYLGFEGFFPNEKIEKDPKLLLEYFPDLKI